MLRLTVGGRADHTYRRNPMRHRIVEIVVKNRFDLQQAISDLEFYYGQLVQDKNNGEMIFGLFADKEVHHDNVIPTETPHNDSVQSARADIRGRHPLCGGHQPPEQGAVQRD